MLKNILRVAFRQMTRQKLYAFLNVAGLSVALASTILIGLFVLEEFGYDRFHDNADRIYRVENISQTRTDETRNAAVQFHVGQLVRDDFPEVQSLVRLWKEFSPLAGGEYPTMRVGDKQFKETEFIFADSTFWDVFSFELVRGDESQLLRRPYEVLLTQSTARKYFGDQDPIGRTMTAVDADIDVTVAGVLQDPPSNSHLKFDIVGSFTTLEQEWIKSTGRPAITSSVWTWTNTWVYVVLEPGARPADLNARMDQFVERNLPPNMRSTQNYELRALTDIHFATEMEGRFEPARSRTMVYAFTAVGLFILLIAAINFMNLAIAHSVRRAREVGVRKAVGARHRQLVGQYLGEALLLAVFAGTVALVMAEVGLPFFNDVVAGDLSLSALRSANLGLVYVGIVLGVGLLSGAYPALVLTATDAVDALSGGTAMTKSRGGGWIRKGLVVTQYTITVALLISTAIIYSQVRFLEGKDLGFNTDDIVMVDTGALRMGPGYNTFVEESLRHSSVRAVSTMESTPGRFVYDYTLRPEGFAEDEVISIPYIWTDSHFFDVFDVELLRGTNEPRSGRNLTYVINETAADRLGWDEPIGKRIYREQNGTVVWQGEVRGIVRDFNFRSLRQPIEPLIIALRPEIQVASMDEPLRQNLGYGIFRVNTQNIDATLAHLESTWKESAGADQAFRYFFLDQDLKELYQGESRISRMITGFAILAIVIACMGLFGLAAHAAKSRMKEIGIRKVLGAGVADVVGLLSREFVLLLLIAIVVAVPVAYVATGEWLRNFAYSIDPGIGLFGAAAITAIVIGTVTVGIQAVRAALADPVDSLRTE